MNGEKLMGAIGGISDRHVVEFAEVKPVAVHKTLWIKAASAAACLCLIVTGTVFFLQKDSPDTPPHDVSAPTQKGEIIWGIGTGDFEYQDYTALAKKGEIVIANPLKNAMNHPENAEDIFAVSVIEATGADKETIYNTFVKPLNLEEDYLESGIVFATKEQIEAFVCPKNLALVLSLGVAHYGDVPVDEAYLKTVKSETVIVNIYFKFNDDAAVAKHKEQLSGANEEEYEVVRRTIIKDEFNKMVTEFISDYDISEESIKYNSFFTSRITVELHADLLPAIMKDERVCSIFEYQDIHGWDMG